MPHQHSRVTYAELFFDLVFVFAVTQISHTLLGRFTPLGALQTTLLFLAVWWVWVYTSWITNWLDPELTPVRVLLFLLMLGGLVLSTSIPKAFESRGLWFALAYAAMQVGRTIFLLVSTPPSRTLARMNAVRILVWLSMSAVFWIAGGFARRAVSGWRFGQWRSAIEYRLAGGAVLDPEIRRVLGRGLGRRRRPHGGALRRLHHHRARRIHRRDRRDVRRSDLDRRRLSPRSCRPLSAASRCGGSISTRAPRRAPSRFRNPREPGRLARLAYTYLHMPIVAGIILSAVADELVLKHPAGHSDLKTVLSAIGGPLLFLLGTILFKHSDSRLASALAWRRHHRARRYWLGSPRDLSPLMLSVLTTAIMIVVAAWETVSLKSGATGPPRSEEA